MASRTFRAHIVPLDTVRVHAASRVPDGRATGTISGINDMQTGDYVYLIGHPQAEKPFRVQVVLDGSAIVESL